MAREFNEVVMVSACRTPIGRYGGTLKDIPANELTKVVGAEAIKRAGIEAGMVDEIVSGMCMHHGNGSLPPRIVAMNIGMHYRSGATMLSQNCASGMRALDVAAMKLMLGKTSIALVTGTESMSRPPYMVPAMRWGARMADTKAVDPILADGLFCSLAGSHMGGTAENVAEMYGITREECDQLAVTSHTRAVRAVDEGRFKQEIVPVEIKSKKGPQFFEADEHPIRGASMESLGRLSPAFKKGGVVTAGNASGMNDASAAVCTDDQKKGRRVGNQTPYETDRRQH